jgi:hypothetical protein
VSDERREITMKRKRTFEELIDPRLVKTTELYEIYEGDLPLELEDDPQRTMAARICVNKQGDLIAFADTIRGTPRRFKKPSLVKIIEERGIVAELASRSDNVCTIGRGADGKWYGWSHRALIGFGPGDRIYEANYGDEKTKFTQHGRRPIVSDADARNSAIAFARYIG